MREWNSESSIRALYPRAAAYHVAVRRALGRPVVRALLGAATLPLLAGFSAQAPVGGWLAYGNDPGRSSATTTSLSPPSLRPAWYTPVAGRISSQALVADDVPA